LTRPEEAKGFVQETKVDSLAIAIGQFVHPLTFGESRPVKKTAKIDFELLEKIRLATGAHLVLHGGSHIPDESIKKTIALGVSEIKVACLPAIAWVDTIRQYMAENPHDLMPANILEPALSEIKRITVESMRLFKSSGKAW